MELVYLWVENYKNIQKQGFNFSPRFTCDYDEETKELSIDENDDYIDNFFGDNINVTAIVGKNGSGKSSILEFFTDFYLRNFDEKKYLNLNYIILISINNKFIFTSLNILKIYNLTVYECQEYNIVLEHMDKDIDNFFKKLSLLTLNVNTYNDEYENQSFYQNKLNLDSTNVSLAMLDSKNIKLSSFFQKIEEVTIKEDVYKYQEIESELKDLYFHNRSYKDGYLHDYKNLKILDDLIHYLNEPEEESQNSKFKNILQLYMLSIIVNQESSIIPFAKGLYKLFKNNKINHFDALSYEDYNKLAQDVFDKVTKESFLYQRNGIREKKFNLKEFEILNQENFKFNKITDRIKKVLNKYSEFLKLNFFTEEEIFFSQLSDGEKKLLGQFSLLHKEILYSKNKNFIFLLDEPEVSFHPYWQKNYIKEFIASFSKYNDISIHLILASHSPFLLSDIPKQNIIFLEKDEDGNCKVVDGLKEKKQTFGANIHTLLSDSFFMEDGLMGEFAKGKIDKAITLLNQDKLSEDDLKYCEQIISIIGEPIVKNQLQRMLDSKRLKKVDEIDAIKKSMDAMQKRLDELEK